MNCRVISGRIAVIFLPGPVILSSVNICLFSGKMPARTPA